jgi:hypothetical protein
MTLPTLDVIDLYDLLTRVSELLDNYVDVNDGADGQPTPNRAMSLQRDVDTMIATLDKLLPKGEPCPPPST